MSLRLLVAACAAGLVGCATSKGAPKPDEAKAGPISERVRIGNQSPFDLAVCAPSPAAAPKPANREIIIASLVGARPAVMECLVDPAHRAQEPETAVSIDATVGDSVVFQVSGANLTPAGKACVEGAVTRATGLAPLPKGSAAASGHIEVRHVVGVSPSVTYGQNEASDLAGRVRVALPTFCDCFAPYAATAPRSVALTLDLVKEKPTAVSHQETDATAAQVAGCLTKKLEALGLTSTSGELHLPFGVRLVHSGADEDLPAAPPELQFLHLDGVRGRRSAQVALAVGERINAVTVYDGLVQRYKAKPSSVPVKELKDRCAAMVRADEGWIAALERQQAVDERTVKLASGLKAQDAQWAAAEEGAQKTLAATLADIANARKTRDADQVVCPKETLGPNCCKQCGPDAKPCGDGCVPAKQACKKAKGCACP